MGSEQPAKMLASRPGSFPFVVIPSSMCAVRSVCLCTHAGCVRDLVRMSLRRKCDQSRSQNPIVLLRDPVALRDACLLPPPPPAAKIDPESNTRSHHERLQLDDHVLGKTMNAEDGGTCTLPLELLPLILQELSASNRLSTLATCSRVCKTWSRFTKPYLWRRLWFRSQDRVRLVFSILGNDPELCKLVRIVELRVYPLGLPAEELEQLEENICRSLRSMQNLQELTWTRTGSLSNRILPDLLTRRHRLESLELAGNTRFYDVDMLWRGDGSKEHPKPCPLPSLRHISFVLPDSSAIKALIELSRRTQLKSITVLCQHTGVLDDVHAQLLGESVQSLEKLVLVGCKRVTADGIRHIAKGSRRGLRSLGLEGCAVHPSHLATLSSSLSDSLRSLIITLPRPSFCNHSRFYTHLASFVSTLTNLTEFTLYAPGGVRADGGDGGDDGDAGGGGYDEHQGADAPIAAAEGVPANPSPSAAPSQHLVPKMPLSFIRSLLTDVKTGLPHRRLTLLRIHGIVCSAQGLRLIGTDACAAAAAAGAGAGLTDLVLQLETGPVLSIISSLLPLAPSLKHLHILSRAGSELFLPDDDVLWIARSLVNYRSPNVYGPLSECEGTTLSQPPPNAPCAPLVHIGFRNRVWEVNRQLCEHGSVADSSHECADVAASEVAVELKRWDASEGRWPEAMLVVRA